MENIYSNLMPSGDEPEQSEETGITKKLYNSIPEEYRPYLNDLGDAAASSATFYGVRSGLPPEMVYGTPEYKAAQAQRINDKLAAPEVQKNAQLAQQTMEQARIDHANEANRLANNFLQAQQEHFNAQGAKSVAESNHFRLNPIEAPPIQAEEGIDVSAKPRGGQQGSKYAITAGASQNEAMRAGSPSNVQSGLVKDIGRATNYANQSGYDLLPTGEQHLWLSPEAREAYAEFKQPEIQAQQAQTAQQQHFANQIEKAKAQVKKDYEAAQKLADKKQAEMEAAKKRLQEHVNTPPMSPAQTKEQMQDINSWDAMRQRIGDNIPQNYRQMAKKVLTTIGEKVAPRYVPMVGAAFAPMEAERAKKDWESGNYGHALAHGAGATGAMLQATGVPPLMGLGDVLQTGSAGLDIYDALKD